MHSTVTKLPLSAAKEIRVYDESLQKLDEEQKTLENLPEKIEKKEAERLHAEEARVNKNNEKFAKGKAANMESLNEFSDLSQEEVKHEHFGLNLGQEYSPWSRMMGLNLEPESVLNDPEARAAMDEVFRQMEEERAPIPKSWNSCDKGFCMKFHFSRSIF